jgi:hypothetical protein
VVAQGQAVSLRVSLVLMILFLALGYFAFFEPLRTVDRDDLAQEKANHVAWLKDRKLSRIAVAGQHPVTLECSLPAKACPFDNSGQWAIAAPEAGGADAAAVGTLASTLLNLTHNGKLDFEKGFDEKEFGLYQPVAAVTLSFAPTDAKFPGLPDLTLKFGSATPTGPELYLSSSEDLQHLYFVPNYLPGMLDQEPFHWRDKRLFPSAESSAVGRISFRSKKAGDIVAEKIGKEWRLEKPRALNASNIMFEGLGNTLAYAAAKSVFAPSRSTPEARKALAAAPALDISFTLNGGAAHRVRLYPAGKQVLALVDEREPVYAVDASTFDRFQQDLAEYRARTAIVEAQRSQVDGLRLRFPRDHQETTLALAKDVWSITQGDKPGDLVLSQGRLNGIVDGLRDSNFLAFFPLKGGAKEAVAFRKETPDVEITLLGAGKPLYQGKFLVFARKAALTESEGDVRALGEGFLKYLPVHLHDLTEPANQTVITETFKGGTAHGNSAQPSHAGH